MLLKSYRLQSATQREVASRQDSQPCKERVLATARHDKRNGVPSFFNTPEYASIIVDYFASSFKSSFKYFK